MKKKVSPAGNVEVFKGLKEGLAGWFDKLLSALPKEKVKLLKGSGGFLFNLWDSISVEQRKAAAEAEDYKNNPANRDEIEREFNLEARKQEIERDIRALELMAVDDPLKFESKNRQLEDYRRQLFELSSGAKRKSNSQPPNKSRSRKDYMAAEIEEVLRDNLNLTPDEVMIKLGTNAGKSGSCVTEYLPTERAVNWKESSGSVSKLTMTLLQKRLSRLRSKTR